MRRTRRWLAVAIVAISLAALLRVTDRRRARAIWMVLAVMAGMACLAALTLTPLGGWLLERSGDRVNIWRNSLGLARDYPHFSNRDQVGIGPITRGLEVANQLFCLGVHANHGQACLEKGLFLLFKIDKLRVSV